MRTLSAIVPPNRKPSWGTTTMRSRSDASVASRRSTPPNVTVAVGRVVQARHQLGERRLAGAGRAHERQPLAVADARATRRRAPRSTFRDSENVTPSTTRSPRGGQRDRVVAFVDVGLGVEDVEQLVRATRSPTAPCCRAATAAAPARTGWRAAARRRRPCRPTGRRGARASRRRRSTRAVASTPQNSTRPKYHVDTRDAVQVRVVQRRGSTCGTAGAARARGRRPGSRGRRRCPPAAPTGSGRRARGPRGRRRSSRAGT